MTIADKIKKFRKQNQLTQEQFAVGAGLTRETVSAIENGYNTNPTLETIISIANALGVTLNDLIDGRE